MKRMKTNEDKNMDTRYKLLQPISGKIICEEACKEEFDKFVKHFGFHTEIEWTKENEDWISENIHLGIKFLEDRGYIKQVETKLKYNPKKIYCFSFQGGGIYKLSMINDCRFTWIDICGCSSRWESRSHETTLEAIESITSHDRVEIKEFNNIRESIDFYFPRGCAKSIGEMTNKEKMDLLYDIKNDLNIDAFNEDSGCPETDGNSCCMMGDGDFLHCDGCKFYEDLDV